MVFLYVVYGKTSPQSTHSMEAGITVVNRAIGLIDERHRRRNPVYGIPTAISQ